MRRIISLFTLLLFLVLNAAFAAKINIINDLKVGVNYTLICADDEVMQEEVATGKIKRKDYVRADANCSSYKVSFSSSLGDVTCSIAPGKKSISIVKRRGEPVNCHTGSY